MDDFKELRALGASLEHEAPARLRRPEFTAPVRRRPALRGWPVLAAAAAATAAILTVPAVLPTGAGDAGPSATAPTATATAGAVTMTDPAGWPDRTPRAGEFVRLTTAEDGVCPAREGGGPCAAGPATMLSLWKPAENADGTASTLLALRFDDGEPVPCSDLDLGPDHSGRGGKGGKGDEGGESGEGGVTASTRDPDIERCAPLGNFSGGAGEASLEDLEEELRFTALHRSVLGTARPAGARRQLFETIAAADGVRRDDRTTDPLGRPAVSLSHRADRGPLGALDRQLFFDPGTLQFLGAREIALRNKGGAGKGDTVWSSIVTDMELTTEAAED